MATFYSDVGFNILTTYNMTLVTGGNFLGRVCKNVRPQLYLGSLPRNFGAARPVFQSQAWEGIIDKEQHQS